MSRWDGWDGVLAPSLHSNPQDRPWSLGLSPSRYDDEVIRVIRQAERLAVSEVVRVGSRAFDADANVGLCASAYVAHVLMTGVFSALGVSTPWGVDVSRVVDELDNVMKDNVSPQVLELESLGQLLQAAQAQRPREPGPVKLEDLSLALFEPSVGLSTCLSRGGLTALGMKGVLNVARPSESIAHIRQESSASVSTASPSNAKDIADRADPFGSFQTGSGQTGSALERFGTDLVALAAEGKLDAVCGREQEVDRILRVLARRNKPNVCLVGPPGVGKTAVVEEIARRIHEKRVPKQVETCKRLIQLSLGSMVGGTRYRGDFEQRMQMLLQELEEAGDSVILFIDEIHMVLGAGETEKGGTMDAANMLKPALARRKMRCIGATTTAEYRRLIQGRDRAFERRFVAVELHEPTEAVAREMLEALRPSFEHHHNVSVSEDTMHAAVVASRALRGRFLPDRALDILDDAATLASMEATGNMKVICHAGHAHRAAKEAVAISDGHFSIFRRWLPWSRL